MEKARGLSLYILCGFIFLYPFFPLIKEWYPNEGTILEFVFVIILIFSSFVYKKDNKIHFSITLITVVCTIFFFAYYIMGIMNDLSSPISGIRCFLLYIFLYTYLKTKTVDRYVLKLLTKAIILSAIISSVGAIIQFVYPEPIANLHTEEMLVLLRFKSDYTAFSKYNRAFSFFNDPNVLGVYLFFSFILYIQYNRLFRTKKSNISNIVYILFIIAIILTRSRTAIFSLIIFLVILTISDLFKKGISAKELLLVLVIFLAGAIFLIMNFDAILTFLRFDTIFTGNGRFAKNDSYTEMIFNSELTNLLFGNGLFDGRDIIFENTFLNIVYMFGFVGMILFYILVIIMFKSDKCRENTLSLICYLVVSYVGDYILIPQITYMFIFIYAFNGRVKQLQLKEVKLYEDSTNH